MHEYATQALIFGLGMVSFKTGPWTQKHITLLAKEGCLGVLSFSTLGFALVADTTPVSGS